MKIKEVRICGFRGIPPVDPPHVDLKFTCDSGEIRDIIIFGPNAYGKSSIADALEWFFREQARGSSYFKNYTNNDNVHLNLGKPSYPNQAFIELVITHNGQDHTVRKCINHDGDKVQAEEQLSSLEAELGKCRDEVIILDHDQFRQFVGSANQEKWTTFSSLIGYEELDHFRAGLDSLSSKSVSDWFKLNEEKRTLARRRKDWETTFKNELQQLGLSRIQTSTSALSTEFMRELEVTLHSLSKVAPESITSIDKSFWTELRVSARPPDIELQRTERFNQLIRLSSTIPHLENSFFTTLSSLVSTVEELAGKKSQFDKQLVAAFYDKGLAIMREGKLPVNECPFCQTTQDWQRLQESVQKRLSSLSLEEIQASISFIQQTWGKLAQELEQAVRAVQRTNLPSLIHASSQIPDARTVQNSLTLTYFDEMLLKQWQAAVVSFNDLLNEQKARAWTEKQALESPPIENSSNFELRSKIELLEKIWHVWQSFSAQQEQIATDQHCYQLKDGIIQNFRDIARSFREELNDFSSRVVHLINDDVARYYDALHPNDGVKPFLETQISGTQRSVQLKCTYQGIPDRDAATLLSESHRNSLGMAVMLAFMKYKRRIGSPIEFLVLDDVTQSFDVGHRLGLLHFLSDPSFPEIHDSQIIFLTHDRTLADLIVRPGEQHENWLRYDIRSWHLDAVYIEPSNIDLFARAQQHLTNGDDIAAAVYGRHALEYVYRSIVETANILMPYNSKPWTTKLEVYQKQITNWVQDLWDKPLVVGSNQYRQGIINPERIHIDQLNRSLRLLHLTVHDSDFLENPPSCAEIATAIQAVQTLRDIFTCPVCRANNNTRFFPSLTRNKQGGAPSCKQCKNVLPADLP